ncbi:MAG: hypothetical protein PVJ21_11745 [Anaerolineales bacterium]|jgi:hypothetical protein
MKKDEQYSILDNKFSEWFENPDQGYTPTPEAEAKHIKQRRHKVRRRHVVNPNKLLEGLIIGFVGVVFCGISFYIVIILANSIFVGW